MGGLEVLPAILKGERPPPPMADLMGFEPLEVEEGRALFVCTPAEHHYNPIGTVHGQTRTRTPLHRPAARLAEAPEGRRAWSALGSSRPQPRQYGTLPLSRARGEGHDGLTVRPPPRRAVG